jgi:hypothetical protein
MTYKTLLILTCSGLLSAGAHAQEPRIVLEGATGPQVFTTFDAALAAAQANDKLYFSGGTHHAQAGIVLDKPLHFIGAGIHPDSSSVTSTTTLTSGDDMRITTAASGSTFTGIRFNPDGYVYYGTDETNDDPTDLFFQRCVFDTRVYLDMAEPCASSSAFDECIFHSLFLGVDGVVATVTRSIFDYAPGTGATISGFGTGGLTMSHCTVLGARVGNSPNANISNSIFTFTSAPFWQSGGSTITNCLVTSDALVSNMSGYISVGNVLNVPAAEIHVNETDDNYQFTDDLHLQPTSIGVGMATDGTDVGIHGSSSPYKPGGVPFNPHFRAAEIAPATDMNGDLPVNIRVAAQSH